MGMGRRRMVNGDENDAYSSWRHVLCYMQRAGVVKRIKRRTHKRERAEWKREVHWCHGRQVHSRMPPAAHRRKQRAARSRPKRSAARRAAGNVMSDMLRGKAYSCGCCRTKPGDVESARARGKREAEREVLDEIAVVEQASDRVDERIEWLDEPILVQRPCCGQGCTHCGNTKPEGD
jgi:hypothetical protein